ncbi:MAG: Bro-N domain-containing protein, partial [Clostridia bacterium]|nr:Bro-N domain-containing protein [Clostridia bacterium]
MSNELKIFENPEFGSIRTLEINGEPWFVGKDIATSLGYANTKDALSTHVDEDDKRILQRSDFATLENHIP